MKNINVETKNINRQTVAFHRYNTIVVGSGAAGMNCAVHLYEFMTGKGIDNAAERIAVVTGGLTLGTSRMSGSDKQTYYKMGTSSDVSDSAGEFAKTLTAGGCCHEDLALAEAIASLREFYHLVQAGVEFPHNSLGSFIGYKTDHDPYERATSAGPKTSKYMSECLQRQVEGYGIAVHDKMEVVDLVTVGSGGAKRIVAVVTINKGKISQDSLALNVFLCRNLVLAAGGPGELYETTVYPKGQLGIHGIAFQAGLAAENLTESQFGLASIKYRWNVSGTYMQCIPRIYSTDADRGNQRDFLADFFPTMKKMASNIFLKGYQWPFDPQRIQGHQSSLIDILVFNETSKGRRVFMDFLHNPKGGSSMKQFTIDDLDSEAYQYLEKTGALQETPIERLAHMNPEAIEIYKENGIDLYSQPLEIAVCAQHNNGGFSVNKWWESNIRGTFVIGEMAGTHGVKRPGGSALNAGQVGGLRAAEYIVNVYDLNIAEDSESEIEQHLKTFIEKTKQFKQPSGLDPAEVIRRIQTRMTESAGHIREINNCHKALNEAAGLYKEIQKNGFKLESPRDIITAIQAEHLALTSIAYLKTIMTLLEQGGGSRGSYLVLDNRGTMIHPEVTDKTTGNAVKFKKENKQLRNVILRVQYDSTSPDLFKCSNTEVRSVPAGGKAFETAWREYKKGDIYVKK